jgi:hypothetical protein
MERLVERFVAGRLWRMKAGVRLGVVAPRGVVGRPGPALPVRFAWLVRLAGWQAAGFGSQLRAVLETPEMVALLEASPQAGRMLRPICRMLAVETSVLRLPARVARAAAVVAVPAPDAVADSAGVARKRAAAVAEPWRIPLPRGVLAAARRQGYGRIRFEKG